MSSLLVPSHHHRRLLVICTLISFLVGCGAEARNAAEGLRPRNLVIICLDTVRYDVFSLPETTGRSDELSPSLADAITFEHGQSPAPWTVPAVASLLTGLYPNQHGAGRFGEEVANLSNTVPSGIRPEVVTLPERLASAGFATAAFVAHPWFRAGYDLDRGFASFELKNQSDRLIQRSLEWLDELLGAEPLSAGDGGSQGPPFFAYLHFMEAHERHRKPLDEVDEIVDNIPKELRSAAAALAADAACLDTTATGCRRFLAYVDAVLELRGRIASFLEGLAERNLLGETLVIAYSDHGEEFAEHLDEGRAAGLDPRAIYGAGHGHTLYQELLHVPLLVWHPGLPGRQITAPATLVDIVPSVIDWLALTQEDHSRRSLPGLPITDLLDDDRDTHRALYSSNIAYGPRQVAVLQGGQKRIHLPDLGIARLFDLERDPMEKTPIDDRQLALPLDRQLARYLELAVAQTDADSAPEVSPELLEQLQSLGYLEGRSRQSATGDRQ